MNNITMLKSLMWEYETLDLYVKERWNCIYKMLKSHNNTEPVDIYCGIILSHIKEKFPKTYKQSELFIKSR